jgi:hypothetical protein
MTLQYLQFVVDRGHANTVALSGRFGLAGRTARKYLGEMLAAGWLERKGPRGLIYLPTPLGRAVLSSGMCAEDDGRRCDPRVTRGARGSYKRMPAVVLEVVPPDVRLERDKQGKAFRRREEGFTWSECAKLEGFESAGAAERGARAFAKRVSMPWPPVRLGPSSASQGRGPRLTA